MVHRYMFVSCCYPVHLTTELVYQNEFHILHCKPEMCLFVSLLEVGEESGKMAPVFEEIATRSRNQFSTWTDRITSLLEPIMILIMGGIVGSVVVVMLMSIISVNDIGI